MERILHVIGAMNRAGAETLIMNLYRVIDRSKYQFDFLVHTQEPCDFDKEIQELGGRIYRIPWFSPTNALQYRRLCRTHFQNHPEHRIVHGHINNGAFVYLKEAHRAGRKTLIHAHSSNFYTGIAHLAFSLGTYPLRNLADCYLACSEDACQGTFGKKIAQSGAWHLIKNGIDPAKYACSPETHEEAKERFQVQERPTFGHVGRFIEVKNHSFLLEVFAKVKNELPNAVLLLAGRGELEESTKQQAAELGLKDSVQFLGARDDIPDLLRALDVFIFPSINEGLSYAVIEAQASGAQCLISTGVPKMALITPQAQQLELTRGTEDWAITAAQAYRRAIAEDRHDRSREITDAGFNIAATVKKLEGLYIAMLA